MTDSDSHPLWDDVGSISPASIPLVATDLISAPLSDSQMTDSDSHHLHGVYAVGIGSASIPLVATDSISAPLSDSQMTDSDSHPLWDDVGSISPASIPLVATDLISAPLSDSQMTDSDSHHLHGVYAVGIGSA